MSAQPPHHQRERRSGGSGPGGSRTGRARRRLLLGGHRSGPDYHRLMEASKCLAPDRARSLIKHCISVPDRVAAQFLEASSAVRFVLDRPIGEVAVIFTEHRTVREFLKSPELVELIESQVNHQTPRRRLVTYLDPAMEGRDVFVRAEPDVTKAVTSLRSPGPTEPGHQPGRGDPALPDRQRITGEPWCPRMPGGVVPVARKPMPALLESPSQQPQPQA